VTAETLKEAKERTAEAWQRKRHYERQLREIFEYIMPYRDAAGLHGIAHQTEGENRTDKVFDGTAVAAGLRFAGRMQRELTPIFQDFFALEAGPLVQEGDQKKALTEAFQQVGKVANGVLASGSFHMKSHELFLDLFAGTGAMNIKAGDDYQPVRFQTVPITEIALEEGPDGDVCGVDWRRCYRNAHLKTLWPRAELSKELKRAIEDSPRGKVDLHQNTYYDHEARRHRLKVWRENGGDTELIWEEDFRTNPWITPRFFVVPGEVYGRGLAHLGLAFCKTTNKARELALLAAAFAVLGLWTRRHDGVFNPDNARFEPLAMWQVSTNGGPLGPTIQRLDVPNNFDISSFVIEDERQQMKMVMMDDALPPLAGAVRSPTEIVERMQLLNQDIGGVFGRMTLEIVAPLVQRVVDILESKGQLATRITIDQLLTQLRVIAPIAAAQQAAKVTQATNWLQLVTMLFGPQAAMLFCKVEELGPELGRWLGVEERFIRSQQEIGDMQKMMASVMAAGQQQEAAAAAPPPASPEQQIVGSGAL
jgi:hypothetical protein